MPFSVEGAPRPKSGPRHLFDPYETKNPTLYSQTGTPNASSEWSVMAQPHGAARHSAKALKSPGTPRHGTSAASSQPQRQPGILEVHRNARYPDLLSQPEARPISQEQLASEVKSIYAGLTMVETKCIHVDRAQASLPDPDGDSKLANDHWQALIALHRTLLHEHHDFFLASQHPSASPALRRLASKY